MDVKQKPLHSGTVEEESRARYEQAGTGAILTDEILLSVLGGYAETDEAAAVIRRLKGSARRVLDAEPQELRNVGAGPEIIFRAQAVRELIRRYSTERLESRPYARSAQEVFDALAGLYSGAKVESMRVLYMDAKNQIIENVEQFRGTVDSSAVYPREIVRKALELGAAAVIVAHNHPSGDPDASACDREITRELVQALRIMGMKLLDHIIVGEHRYFSFADHGLIADYDLIFLSSHRQPVSRSPQGGINTAPGGKAREFKQRRWRF